MNHKPSALARDTTKQEPAPASSKAMWIEAKQLLPGDVIVRLHRVDSCPQHDVVTRDNVDEVKFGWWCRAYVLANGSHVRVPSERSATVRQIQAHRIEGEGMMSGSTTPKPGVFAANAEPVTRRATGLHELGGGRNGGSLSKWDGKPKRFTAYH